MVYSEQTLLVYVNINQPLINELYNELDSKY